MSEKFNLNTETAANFNLKDFLEKLGSDAPTPGGGSAAALSGAMGAALVSMVCNLSLGRPKYAEFENLINKSLLKSNALIYKMLETMQDDINAYNGVMKTFKLPKSTDDEIKARRAALDEAYKRAIIPPENTANSCIEIMRMSRDLLNKSNKNAESDLTAAAVQAYAGLISALENVKINLASIERLDLENKRLGLENKKENEKIEFEKIKNEKLEIEKLEEKKLKFAPDNAEYIANLRAWASNIENEGAELLKKFILHFKK